MSEGSNQPCRITDLPEEVLRKILKLVPFCTRHNTLPLVSTTWNNLLKSDTWSFVAIDEIQEREQALVLGRRLRTPFDLQRFLTWFQPKSAHVEELWVQFGAFSPLCEDHESANEYYSLADPVLVPVLSALSSRLERLRLHLPHQYDLGACLGQLKECSQLKVLDLTVELAYEGLQFDGLGHLVSLETLSIVVTEPVRFSGIPESLTCLTHLKVLNMEINNENYSELQPSFGSLTTLQHLSLRGFRFLTFPDSVTKLTALEFLDLSYNDYGLMPELYCDGLTALTKLTALVSQRNLLHHVPKAVGLLHNLQVLDLDSNSEYAEGPSGTTVTTLLLPDTLTALTNLNILVLNNNVLQVEDLDMLSSLVKLERLDLNNCQLQAVPDCVSALTTLRYLDLGHNLLRSFPTVIATLPKLTYLFLHCNPHLELDLDALCIVTLPSLHHVDVRKCVDGSERERWSVISCMVLLILIAIIDYTRVGPTLIVSSQTGVQIHDGGKTLYDGRLYPFALLKPVQTCLFTRHRAWWQEAERRYHHVLWKVLNKWHKKC